MIESACGSLEIRISETPAYSRTTTCTKLESYGYLHNPEELDRFDIDLADDDSVGELVNRLGGYFCLVITDLRTGTTRLATDLYGNYRLYAISDGQSVIISDDWRALTERLRDQESGVEINPHEQYYFQRHRYTTGGGTFVKGLHKILPGSLLTQRDGRLNWRPCLRTRIERQYDDSRYAQENLCLITETIRDKLQPDRPNLLFFSGGIDSTFLACVMGKAGIEFTPLLTRWEPTDRDNLVDQNKARIVTKHLGLPLMVCHVDLQRNQQLVDRAALRNPFDKPYPVPFEYTYKWLAEKYGPCNIINGQSSDSIYCWGASGKTIGSFLQRFLVNDLFVRAPGLARRLAASAIAAVYRRRWSVPYRFRVPVGEDDYWVGLLDPQGYLPVVHTEQEYAEYHSFLQRIVTRLRQGLDNDSEAMRIYMKMMYLQGPANVYIIQAARGYGHNLILPFVDARVLNLRRRYQNDKRDLVHPRYVLEKTLTQTFGFDPAIVEKGKKVDFAEADQTNYEQLVKQAYQRWDSLCRDLF